MGTTSRHSYTFHLKTLIVANVEKHTIFTSKFLMLGLIILKKYFTVQIYFSIDLLNLFTINANIKFKQNTFQIKFSNNST